MYYTFKLTPIHAATRTFIVGKRCKGQFWAFYISTICHDSRVRPFTQALLHFPCINRPAKWPVSHRNSCVWFWRSDLWASSHFSISLFILTPCSSCTLELNIHSVVNTCVRDKSCKNMWFYFWDNSSKIKVCTHVKLHTHTYFTRCTVFIYSIWSI